MGIRKTRLAWLMERVAHQGDDCLLWPFSVGSSGYGGVAILKKFHYAHRYMCQLAHGEPPTEKHHARHSCNNPRCVNPRHLSWGTSSDNQFDRKSRGRPRFKLTPEKVAEIRAHKGIELVTVTAARYGVTEVTIRHIQSGKTWQTDNYRFGGFSVAPAHRQTRE